MNKNFLLEQKAKIFCKFLNEIPLGAKLEASIFSNYIQLLHQLCKIYPKHWKLYSWLFVKFLCLNDSDDVQRISFKSLSAVFDDELVNPLITSSTSVKITQ